MRYLLLIMVLGIAGCNTEPGQPTHAEVRRKCIDRCYPFWIKHSYKEHCWCDLTVKAPSKRNSY